MSLTTRISSLCLSVLLLLVTSSLCAQQTAISKRIIYTSQLLGTFGDAVVAPGGAGTLGTDRAAAINAALSGGNVWLIVDGQYSLSTSLVLASNTKIDCLPGNGFIMRTAANAPVLVNKNPASPTTSDGTSGFLPSNITDQNIAITGCILNMNSVVSVTGTSPDAAAHKVCAVTNVICMGTQFLGVSGLLIANNEVYDTGMWAVAFSNITNFKITNNYIHQTLPLTAKNTDGIHCIGPCTYGQIIGNRIVSDDDSIALNADDGNSPGTSDAFSSYVPAAWKWGQITNINIDNTFLDNAGFGFRLLSTTDLIDAITIRNTKGAVGTRGGIIGNTYGTSNGVFGTIIIDDWYVAMPTAGGAASGHWVIQGTVPNLEVNHVQLTNMGSNESIVYVYAGGITNLAMHDWNINNASGTDMTSLVITNGLVVNLTMSGINYVPPMGGTGTVLSGTTVPIGVTISNYSGPNRLLASGYLPTYLNGDAFTNLYANNGTLTGGADQCNGSGSFGTIYFKTLFNEGLADVVLSGTVPATNGGGFGGWGVVGSGLWTYSGSNSVINAKNTATGFVGGSLTNTSYTIRATVTSAAPAGQEILLRYGSSTSYVGVQLTATALTIHDVVAGASTTTATAAGNFATGSVKIVANGTAISATMNGVTISGTLSATNGANTTMGWDNTVATNMALSCYEASSL